MMTARAVVYFNVLTGLATLAVPARAVDRVQPKEGPSVVGTAEPSRYEVVVRHGVKITKVPVNEIKYVVFDTDPTELQSARMEVLREEYDTAMKTLAKVTQASLRRPETKTEYQFYKAFASAHIALAEGSPKAIADAGRQLMAFEKNEPESYHYLQACELLGDLLVALGKHDMAATYYEKLASSPWSDMQLHAASLVARSLVSQKKYREAIDKYDQILQMGADGKEATRERNLAKLGRVVALAGTGKTGDAVKQLNQLIEQATDGDGDEYYARAYNALGSCYRVAGKPKEALQAFLHTDLLYNKAPAEHAEALANLAALWGEANQGPRGMEALKTLKERYPMTEWARQGPVK